MLLCVVETLFWPPAEPVPTKSIAVLCGLWLLTFLGPRLLGLAEAMLFRAKSYGGLFELFLGGLVEILFTLLVTPIMMAASSFFMFGLAIGRTVGWEIQQREGHQMSWLASFALLWPQTLLGLMLTLTLALRAPHALVWFLPFLLSLLLAVPFAVVTSSGVLARWADRTGLCRLPEEIHEPKEIRDVREGRISG
jgi:membrane glycosyltransferase